MVFLLFFMHVKYHTVVSFDHSFYGNCKGKVVDINLIPSLRSPTLTVDVSCNTGYTGYLTVKENTVKVIR